MSRPFADQAAGMYELLSKCPAIKDAPKKNRLQTAEPACHVTILLRPLLLHLRIDARSNLL
jgi:hypothetical protein